MRHSAGLTLQQLAGRLGRDHSTVSRWERGATKPSIQDASAFLAVLDVIGEERDRILELTQYDGLRDWIVPPVGQQLAALMEYERVASAITEANPLLIPGLLQTRAYARSIMVGWGATEEEAERSAAVRGDRQGVLTRRNPVEYLAVIGAGALVCPPCSDDIMREQCDRLLAMSARPNISLRVVPQRKGNYNPSLVGPFILLELPRDTPVVYLESYGASSIVTNYRAIDLYLRAIDEINRAALSESESARFIKDIREKQ